MTVLGESTRPGGFVLSGNFDTGYISADPIIVKSGQTALQAGTVLGRVNAPGNATETHAGNAGNGVLGAVTVGDGALPGVYVLKVTKASADAGDFEVIDPTGKVVGLGTVGVAFNGGGLSFTLADGATDFAVGDKFLITVTVGAGKYVQLNLSGTDGSEAAAGILWAYTDASSADASATAITHGAEVLGSLLAWPAGITVTQKARALAQLASLDIAIR